MTRLASTTAAIAGAAVLALLDVQPAVADGLLDVLRESGLMGTWAPSCDAPPGRDNRYHTYSRSESARARVRYEPGNEADGRTSDITGASRMSAGRLRLSIVTDDERWGRHRGWTWVFVMEIGSDHLRIIEAIRSDGRAMIEDGRIMSSGKPSPTLHRCGAPDA